jgi:hypothetical protein
MELFRSGTVRKPYPVRTYCPTALVKVVGVLWIWVEERKAKICPATWAQVMAV